ncbi:MAG: hypothetical protein CL677_03080 [Bdellovibrionaceae bacterium]|nr:hypothetical protein [Pseudobdellovibrionaceae bacterium]
MNFLTVVLSSLMIIPMAYGSGKSGDQEATKVFDYEKAPASSDDDGLGVILTDDIIEEVNAPLLDYSSDVLVDDMTMYNFCGDEVDSQFMNECIALVKGHRFYEGVLNVCKQHDNDRGKLSCLEIIRDSQFQIGTTNVCNSSTHDLNSCMATVKGQIFENDPLMLCKNKAPQTLNFCLKNIANRSFDLYALSVCELNTERELSKCLDFIADQQFEPAVQVCRKNEIPNSRTLCTDSFLTENRFGDGESKTIYIGIEGQIVFTLPLSDFLLSDRIRPKYKTYVELVVQDQLKFVSGDIDDLRLGWNRQDALDEGFKQYKEKDFWSRPTPAEAITHMLVEEILPTVLRRGRLFEKNY